MSGASTSGGMSPQLLEVVERARREEPEGRFHALAHRIDVSALERAYHRMRKDEAVGVDGVTKEQYGRDLERNLRGLHARMKAKRYRHQPIRRVHIPKEGGKTRPIGISAFEDKLVQDAVREVLEAIYEQDFLDCSYGFRPGRSAHDAVGTLDRVVHQRQVNWILEADILSFLHWFERRVKPRLRGQATLLRYADDFVIAFEFKDDAQRVRDALGTRLGHFGGVGNCPGLLDRWLFAGTSEKEH
jgi:RNA-directed DNA polymerase